MWKIVNTTFSNLLAHRPCGKLIDFLCARADVNRQFCLKAKLAHSD